MGLDMYLYVKHYINIKDDEHKKNISELLNQNDCQNIKPENISYILEEVIYWRKANQIHKWFVDNVQGGNDDQRFHQLTFLYLDTLKDTINEVIDASELIEGPIIEENCADPIGNVVHKVQTKIIKNPSVAQKLLPTESGFFFGRYEYDEYYLDQLIRTKNELDKLSIYRDDCIVFFYHANW